MGEHAEEGVRHLGQDRADGEGWERPKLVRRWHGEPHRRDRDHGVDIACLRAFACRAEEPRTPDPNVFAPCRGVNEMSSPETSVIESSALLQAPASNACKTAEEAAMRVEA